MTALEKLQEKLNIEIDGTYNYNMYDLEVSTYNTADGYEVYVMNSTPFENGLDWENDVYYYQPSFDDIMDRIMQLDAGSKVYVDDIEEYMPEYEIETWINDNEDTDEDY
tara:strand:- start:1579 stop:1905 length:327 start_codon:yes stop_codon:yes gene_type:complete